MTTLETTRILLVEDPEDDALLMEIVLATRSNYPAIANAWARVGELARDQNEINGFMMAMQLQRTQRQIACLIH